MFYEAAINLWTSSLAASNDYQTVVFILRETSMIGKLRQTASTAGSESRMFFEAKMLLRHKSTVTQMARRVTSHRYEKRVSIDTNEIDWHCYLPSAEVCQVQNYTYM